MVKNFFWKIGFASLLLIVDQLSKFLVSSYFTFGFTQPLIHFFGIDLSLTYTVNTGTAWGFLSDYPTPLVIFRLCFVAALLYYLCFRNQHLSWQYPLIMIIMGAIGNIIDMFLRGHVVDMIFFQFWGYHYPVFNMADSIIFIGTFWLLFAKKEMAVQKSNIARLESKR